MPVILAEEDHQAWLDPGTKDQDLLRALLAPCPDGQLTAIPVSSHVNNPRHDDKRCIVEAPKEQELF
jgi:putative SOS response-associated peptidase YedK